MIGHVQDIPRVLKKAYDIRHEYMSDFVNAFVNHDFKKVYFLGSGTSHHVALVIRNIFVDILKQGITRFKSVIKQKGYF